MKKKKKWPKVIIILILVIILLWGCTSLLDDEEYDDAPEENTTISEEVETEVDTDIAEADTSDDAGTDEAEILDDADASDDTDIEESDTPDDSDIDEADATVEEELNLVRTNTKITFSSTDVNGNPIDDSIFAENKVTLVNLWEPWCGPCRMEMPDLDTIYREYKDWGLMVIGVHSDNDDLKQVLKETGVTYPIVNSTKEFNNILNTTGAYPTTFFVDSEGYILEVQGENYFVGYESYDEWKDKIESFK